MGEKEMTTMVQDLILEPFESFAQLSIKLGLVLVPGQRWIGSSQPFTQGTFIRIKREWLEQQTDNSPSPTIFWADSEKTFGLKISARAKNREFSGMDINDDGSVAYELVLEEIYVLAIRLLATIENAERAQHSKDIIHLLALSQ
ncbi:F-box domain protein [Penicillium macrosclerotiorum]|uniref:F-box domain protein n=1 Tax=Penicillium macrosclerotiorum TaxID=303699 RepID=UPI0025468872|nr:F-box domain protein [Penicillium macrosclerotiorum]KAJ5666788.1 F-box domain protein [Penicillium macrosclerotiorum]